MSGVTRTAHPVPSRTTAISSGLSDSLPGQNGHGPRASPASAGGSPLRARVSAPRSGAMITHRRRMGSRRSSDMRLSGRAGMVPSP